MSSNLAKKLDEGEEGRRLTTPINRHIVDLNNYLSVSPRATPPSQDDEALPAMFWSKHRVEKESGDRPQGRAEAPVPAASLAEAVIERKLQLSPYLTAALLLGLLSGGAVIYGMSGKNSKAIASPGSEVNRAFSAVAASPAEIAAPQDDPLPSAARGLSTDEQESWAATLTLYKQLVAQQAQSSVSDKKQAENERLFQQLEGWMNKTSK